MGSHPVARARSCYVPVPKSGTCGQTAFGESDPQRKAVRAHGGPGVWDPGASPKGQLGSCTPGTETEKSIEEMGPSGQEALTGRGSHVGRVHWRLLARAGSTLGRSQREKVEFINTMALRDEKWMLAEASILTSP